MYLFNKRIKVKRLITDISILVSILTFTILSLLFINTKAGSEYIPYDTISNNINFQTSVLDCSSTYDEITESDIELMEYLTPEIYTNQQANVSYHHIGQFEFGYQCL
jgi:hypothetical protein